jgi:hypothetical protein
VIKQGDLVTVALENNTDASNTYAVARKLDGESLLSHPLFPNIFILKNDGELNLVAANIKNDEERCLSYALRYRKYLDFDTVAELESLSMYFIVYHQLSNAQKKSLANMCGTIAAMYSNNDLDKSIELVNENQALLNNFNRWWFQNLEEIFTGQKKQISRRARTSVFNIAGFILAQLEGISNRR